MSTFAFRRALSAVHGCLGHLPRGHLASSFRVSFAAPMMPSCIRYYSARMVPVGHLRPAVCIASRQVAQMRFMATGRKRPLRGMEGKEEARRQRERIRADYAVNAELAMKHQASGSNKALYDLEKKLLSEVREKFGMKDDPSEATVQNRRGANAVKHLQSVTGQLQPSEAVRVGSVLGALIDLEYALDTMTVTEAEADQFIARFYILGNGEMLAEVESILSRAWMKPVDDATLGTELVSQMEVLTRLNRILLVMKHPDTCYRAAQDFRSIGMPGKALHTLHVISEGARAHPPALLTLAKMYDAGEGMPADPAKAANYRVRARWLGALSGYRRISEYVISDRTASHTFHEDDRQRILEYDADGVFTEDAADSIRFLGERAEEGDALAHLVLGFKFMLGEDVDKSEELSFKHFLQAANAGLWKAEHNVACMYLSGTGTPKNPGEAIKYLERSAAKNHALSTIMLGVIHRHGMAGGKPDLQAAMAHFDSARLSRVKEEASVAETYRRLTSHDMAGKKTQPCYVHWAQLGSIDVSGEPDANK